MRSSAPIPHAPFGFRLDPHSGVPVYRQLMDQVQAGVSAGALKPGEQLPTVRQVAVDLTINPNTVQRAYREMEIRGLLETQQGTGTFIAAQKTERSKSESRAEFRVDHERRRALLASEFASRAGAGGFSLQEIIESLRALIPNDEDTRS